MSVPIRRSPSYPRISLDRAVILAEKVYDSAYQSAVDTTTVLELMGYLGKSGPATAALSSVKQYGLIEGRDQALKVTPLALRILHPTNDLERRMGLKEAVLAPQFYNEIRMQFEGKIPADQVLKSHLVRVHGFNPNGADDFIRILKDNRPYIDLDIEAHQTKEHEAENKESDKANTAIGVAPSAAAEDRESEMLGEPNRDIFRFRISPTCTVRIIFSGPVTQNALEKTIQYLELAKDSYTED
jgi:hypothetical protein